MLLRFAVQNFLSFKDMTEFRMSAGKIMRHKDHVAEVEGNRILKGGFLFGANAGGKSNFIHAVNFAQNIVLNGMKSVNCNKKYFRIEEGCKHQPGVFQFDIATNGGFYSYGFAISYETASVEEEWLYPIGETKPGLYKMEAHEPCVFLRRKVEDGKSYEIESDLNFPDEQKERFHVYMDDFRSPKMAQTLFLSDIVKRSPDDSPSYRSFTDVFGWFQQVIIVFPNAKYGPIVSFLDDSDRKTELESLLRYFDTGIVSVSKNQIDFNKALLEWGFPETIQSELMQRLNTEQGEVFVESEGKNFRVGVKSENGNIVADKLMSSHGNDEDLFDLQDESDGTRRLFDLIPLFQYALKNHVIFVDELDRSLHTKATQEFIRHYYEIALDSHSQLIVTTQDSNVMDLDLLRQDEIWFVERKKDHSSHLYSLNQFRERFDKKVAKDYLLGRYGALPVFGQLDSLETDGEANGE